MGSTADKMLKAAKKAKAKPSPNGQHSGPPKVVEAANDPHRLAKMYLSRRSDADGQLLFRTWNDEFFQHDGSAYRKLPDGDVEAQVVATIKDEYDRIAIAKAELAAKEAAEAGGDGEKPKVVVPEKVTTAIKNNTLQAIRSQSLLSSDTVPGTWLSGKGPGPADLFVTRNTILNLEKFVKNEPDAMIPQTARLFMLSAAELDFDPAAPRPEKWLSSVNEWLNGDDQSIATLQEIMGYFLTCDTRLQKLFLFVGPKRSGKGTIARIIRMLLGAKSVCGPTLGSLGAQFGLAPLISKSLAVIADARLGGRSDLAVITERLLSISGEDVQNIDRKFLPAVDMQLAVRFLILTNELPKLADASGALASRFVVLRFPNSFYGKENTKLTGELMAELPGILLWSIAGWARLRERGHFIQPDAASDDVQELEDLGSPIQAFVRECCVVGPAFQIEKSILFGAWKRWCEDHGRDRPGDSITFGRNLRAAVPGLRRAQPRNDSGVRLDCYEGIARL